MSEYKVRSSYFSTKNKVLLILCIIFFAASTHIFKNVLSFVFMFTQKQGNEENSHFVLYHHFDLSNNDFHGEIKLESEILKNPMEGTEMNEKNNTNEHDYVNDQEDIDKHESANEIAYDPTKILYSIDVKNQYIKGNISLNRNRQIDKKVINGNFFNNRISNQNIVEMVGEVMNPQVKSIYLYSNVLSLMYISSLITYFIILLFNISKNNNILKIFYMLNLLSHCIIFSILSQLEIYNNYENTSMMNHGSTINNKISYTKSNSVMFPSIDKSTLDENDLTQIEQRKKDLNVLFKNNMNNNPYIKYSILHNFSPNQFDAYFIDHQPFLLNPKGVPPTIVEQSKQEKTKNTVEADQEKDDKRTQQEYTIMMNKDPKTEMKSMLKLLYLCIILSSVCSGYINIYQKKILYCVCYIKIGLTTSLLILLNNLFRLLAHSLNQVYSYILKTNISSYVFLFLIIDCIGLIMVLIFSYLWDHQKTLWINLHKIFYNYQYVCFYFNQTYYIYTTDKNIDNIMVNIEIVADKNIDISFCAYTHLEKSVFYEYFILNKFRNNKLRIVEIKDKNFKIESTYRNNTPKESKQKEKEKVEVAKWKTDVYSRKKNHSFTMKPYSICIGTLNKGILHNIIKQKDLKNQTSSNSSGNSKRNTDNKQITESNTNQFVWEQEPEKCISDVAMKKHESVDNTIEKENCFLNLDTGNDNMIYIYKKEQYPKYEINKYNLSKMKEGPKNNSDHVSNNFLDIYNNNAKEEGPNDKESLANFLENEFTLKANAKQELCVSLVPDKKHINIKKNDVKKKKKNSKIHFENEKRYEVEKIKYEQESTEEINIAEENDICENEDLKELEEKKKNVLLIPDYEETDNKDITEENYDMDYDKFFIFNQQKNFSLSDKDHIKKKRHCIIEYIKIYLSSYTVFFLYVVFIHAFLLSIIHIFVNYFFYIYLFVFNINVYVSNIYAIIMTGISLLAIPLSGYIIDNIGAFFSLLLCSSFFILIAVMGSIISYKNNINSEILAFAFFILIGISESVIPTVLISQIPTHLCVKNNEHITSAFAIFELMTMIIVSFNNYVFGLFLRKGEYLKGLYILFFLIIVVIITILMLIVTTHYMNEKCRKSSLNKLNTCDLTQPLL